MIQLILNYEPATNQLVINGGGNLPLGEAVLLLERAKKKLVEIACQPREVSVAVPNEALSRQLLEITRHGQ